MFRRHRRRKTRRSGGQGFLGTHFLDVSSDLGTMDSMGLILVGDRSVAAACAWWGMLEFPAFMRLGQLELANRFYLEPMAPPENQGVQDLLRRLCCAGPMFQTSEWIMDQTSAWKQNVFAPLCFMGTRKAMCVHGTSRVSLGLPCGTMHTSPIRSESYQTCMC